MNTFDKKSEKILKKYPFLNKLPKEEQQKWIEIYKTLPCDYSGKGREILFDSQTLEKLATKRAFALKYGKRPEHHED